MQTHYQVLNLPPAASLEEIKAAYKSLAKVWHPDLHLQDERALNEVRFSEITCAYSVLKDEKRRQEYDTWLRMTNKPCVSCGGSGVVWRQKGFTARFWLLCNCCDGIGFEL